MPQLTIYSRNVFGVPFFTPPHRPRMAAIAEQALDANADIILLQEIFLPSDRTTFREKLGTNFRYFRSRHGFFRLGGGLLAITEGDFQIAQHQFIPFEPSGFWFDSTMSDHIAQKGFQIFTIEAPLPLTLINTHLTCPYVEDLDAYPHRKNLLVAQLHTIAEHTKDIKGPIILCGDFNLGTQHPLMRAFRDTTHFEDRAAHIGNTVIKNLHIPRWFPDDPDNETPEPDHVLAKNIPAGWRIETHIANHESFFVSDHAGIVTTITY